MNVTALYGVEGTPDWMKGPQTEGPGPTNKALEHLNGTTTPAPAGTPVAGQQDAATATTVQGAQPAQTGGGTPATAAPAPAPTSGMTFAQMQAQGFARPAPPVAAPQVSGGGAVGGSALRGDIQGMLQQLMAKPSSYDDAAMMAEFTKGARGIDDQFTLARRDLDDTMAKRGIYDSTIMGDRTHDLNVGKRSAQTNLLETLAIKRAETGSADLRSAIAAAMGFDSQLAGEQEGAANRAQAGQIANAQLQLQSRGLDQNDADRMLRQMFGLEDINLRREGMASDNANRAADRSQQASQFLASLGLDTQRLGLQKDSLALEKDRDAWTRTMQEKGFTADEAQRMWEREQRGKEFDFTKDRDAWDRKYADNNALMEFLSLLAGQQFLPGGDTGSSAPAPTSYPTTGGGGGAVSWEQLIAPYLT